MRPVPEWRRKRAALVKEYLESPRHDATADTSSLSERVQLLERMVDMLLSSHPDIHHIVRRVRSQQAAAARGES